MKFHAPATVLFSFFNLIFSLLAFNHPVGAQAGSPAMDKKEVPAP